MYQIHPPAVYVHQSVMANPVYRARVEKVTSGLSSVQEINTYSDQDLPDLYRQGIAKNRVAMGTLEKIEDPILVFNTFQFGREKELLSWQEKWREEGIPVGSDLLGLRAFAWSPYNLKEDRNREYKVCRPCWRIHLQTGCLHRCLYCGLGGLLVAAVNIEEYCQHLQEIIDRHPWQKTYLLDDDADPPGLEPELGCLGKLIEFFGQQKDRYLIIHTKTWNTQWMTKLKSNGNTIIVWSISPVTQSTLIEAKAGTTAERIQAARISQEAGYQIRYKFKPIIPVRNWEKEARETIEQIFTWTQPDVISLACFMWMDFYEMKKRLGKLWHLLDPECVKAAEEKAGQADNPCTEPFPDEVRAKIYRYYLKEIRRHKPDLPVSLSTESWQMWSALGPELGFTATDYVCGCGPMSTPKCQRLTEHPFQAAVKDSQGIPGTGQED
ncbi:MAG: hypothetical protein NC911_04015 [Candidatus Omnitrophica bacterium]|nr:hypothetical protein [Candidatus Omnitrophota bacterium]